VLRRYLAPQRDATARLQSEEQPWIDTREKARLREVTDRVVRYIEDLDSVRDRAAVIQDELASRLSEQMNRTMYHLTVVASIMLPLGFLTGLLGINVGGIPGSETPWAFAAVCAILAAVVAVQVVLFRRLRWL
jgi:zinc transporter